MDCRVEKYRPNTLDDVSGHQDILATINKFVDTNVRDSKSTINSPKWKTLTSEQAITTSASLWSTRHGQNIYHSSFSQTDLRKQEHAADGSRAEC